MQDPIFTGKEPLHPEQVVRFVRARERLGPIDDSPDVSIPVLGEERMFPVRYQHGHPKWPSCVDVGATRLIAARGLAKDLGVDAPLFLKWEGTNPTGTHKDRIAEVHVREAKNKGFKEITAATCGNYGEALALAARTQGLKCTIFVPEKERENPHREADKCIERMEACGAEVRTVCGGYEQAVLESERHAAKGNTTGRKRRINNIYDANPPKKTGEKFELELDAYSEIAYEIQLFFRDRGEKVSHVVVPVGNGLTILGIERGFARLHAEGVIERIPHFIGASQNNWATWSGDTANLARNIKHGRFDLRDGDNGAIAGPALAWKPTRGLLAPESGNFGVDVGASELRRALRIFKKHFSLEMLEESGVVLAAIKKVFSHLKEKKVDNLKDGAIVLVVTGEKD